MAARVAGRPLALDGVDRWMAWTVPRVCSCSGPESPTDSPRPSRVRPPPPPVAVIHGTVENEMRESIRNQDHIDSIAISVSETHF